MKTINSILLYALFVFFFATAVAVAQTPNNFRYQGQLRDGAGNLISGTENLSFDIYDTSAGGTILWSEVKTNVTIDKGYFSVILGETDGFNDGVGNDLDFNSNTYYLEVTVGSEVQSPRQLLTSVATAMTTKGIQTLSSAPLNPTRGATYFDSTLNILRLYDGTNWITSSFTNLSDTNIMGAAAGDIIYFDGSEWVNLGIGTAGQALVINSGATAPEWFSQGLINLSDVNSATVDAGNVLVADGTDFESVAISGDVTLTDLGVTEVQDNAVDGTDIALTDEAVGSLMYYDGTDWVHLPAGTAGQTLIMNTGATAPEWSSAASTSSRVGEFVYAKSGRLPSNGYLPVNPGIVVNGAVDYPVWAAMYPEFVNGNDIEFPNDVEGMFLRNLGGNAAPEGNFQTDRTDDNNLIGTYLYQLNRSTSDISSNTANAGSLPNTNVNNSTGGYSSYIESGNGDRLRFRNRSSSSAVGSPDPETNPINRAYQLYTIVDTYR